MKRYYLLFVGLLFVGCAAQKTSEPKFPDTCKQECVSEFGEKLGSAAGINAYSNCKASCVYEHPHFEGKTYSGIEWQCVEYARRWLIAKKGLTFGSVDVAADIWNGVKELTALEGGRKVPLRAFTNGSVVAPRAGDLLVYAREYLGTGHVAVVLAVGNRWVRVGEENLKNEKWPGDYAREIPLIRDNADGKPHYWLLDEYLLGWKSY